MEENIAALETALKIARENENRWMEISAEFSTDPERMEQWSSTVKLGDSKLSGSRLFWPVRRCLVAWRNRFAVRRLKRKTEWERRH